MNNKDFAVTWTKYMCDDRGKDNINMVCLPAIQTINIRPTIKVHVCRYTERGFQNPSHNNITQVHKQVSSLHHIISQNLCQAGWLNWIV